MKLYVGLAATALILVLSYFLLGYSAQNTKEILAKVKKGNLTVNVTTSGELYAKKSVDIRGPEGLRSVGIWQVKISDIIAEGTVVKKGDFIASLDASELLTKIRSQQADLDKATSQYTQAQLDTTLELRDARDNLTKIRYEQQEKRLELQQSKYEPPATIKKAELELEKSERAYHQTLDNYKVKQNKAIAKVQETAVSLNKAQKVLEDMQNTLKQFQIEAPEGGMMIYYREWDGQKRRQGSMVGAWDPVVATLPDMSYMVSRTYINEVDIRKIKKGQTVKIGLDAMPEKKLTGKVIEIANIGEQKPNSDAKVFEVNIELNEKDKSLLPAMTTSNLILVEVLLNVLYIPLEALHTKNNMNFVYKKTSVGLVKQEVKIGKMNDNEVQILKGLAVGEEVSLSIPKEADKLNVNKLQ